MSLLETFNQKQLQTRPKVRSGDLVRVYQKDLTKEGKKAQIFEGVVIARKHGFGRTATITVRREVGGIAIEKVYPLHSPIIEKIEIVQRSKVRQAKLYYLRDAKGKRARLKRKDIDLSSIEETIGEKIEDSNPEIEKTEEVEEKENTPKEPEASPDKESQEDVISEKEEK